MKTRSLLNFLILLLFFVLETNIIQGQTGYSQNGIIPPSPTAASLGVFGDIPVSYYTGTPDISIPLFKIETANLSLPITLSYNATGIRVAQDASWVGLGWSLSAGGLITRIIRGKDDFADNTGYLRADTLPRWDNQNRYWYSISDTSLWKPTGDPTLDSILYHDGYYFSDMKRGYKDGEPDIFSYNFGQYSGKFVIDKQQKGSKIFAAKRDNLDFKFDQYGDSFTITTPDGCEYYFCTKEVVFDCSSNNNNVSNPSIVNGIDLLTRRTLSDNSSWYLDRIKSASGDTIRFFYKTGESLSLISKYERNYQVIFFVGIAGDLPNVYNADFLSRQYIHDVYLSKIEFNNDSITFQTTDREDIEPVSSVAQKPQKLSKIRIYNSSGLIKEISLGHSYFNQQENSYSQKRLKLDYVQMGEPENKYSFAYFEPNSLPDKCSRQVDEWGFYTPPFTQPLVNGYPTLLPAVTYPDYYNNYHFLPGVNSVRGDTSGLYIKRGMLSSITYPTKGRTEFEFEPNEHSGADPINVTINQYAIVDTSDPDSVNYIYHHIDTLYLTSNTYVRFTARYDYSGTKDTNFAYLKNSNGGIIRAFKTSDQNTTLLLNSGTYTIQVQDITNHRTELQATYEEIRGYENRGNGIRIKNIINYNYNNIITGVKNFTYSIYGADNEFYIPSGLLLVSPKNTYFKTIRAQRPEYGELQLCTGIYVVRTASSSIPTGFYSQPNVVGYSKVCVKEGLNGKGGATIYNFYNEQVDNSELLPEMPEVFDSRNGQLLSVEVLDSLGSFVKKIEYNYDCKEKQTIKGIKIYKAPFDNTLAFSCNHDLAYYDNVSEWWVQSSKIETNYFNNKKIVAYDTSIYNNYTYKQISSREVTQSDGTKQITFYKYPYDYDSISLPVYDSMVNRHIIAPVIEQLTYKDQRFLESTRTKYFDWGNNILAPDTVVTTIGASSPDTLICYYGYDNKGNVLSMAKKNDMLVSYIWGYDQTYPVIKAENIDYATLNTALNTALSIFQCDLQGFLTDSIADITSETQKNAWKSFNTSLRIALPSSTFVTTYTYKPLVGMTSQTDANGVTTYYEYDSFGRLKLIRDNKGYILKTYELHYKQ
jgi:YD repeat-containing protein